MSLLSESKSNSHYVSSNYNIFSFTVTSKMQLLMERKGRTEYGGFGGRKGKGGKEKCCT